MLYRYILISLFLSFIFLSYTHAQNVRGKIFQGKTDYVLIGVNVHNISQDLYKTSDLGGNFIIAAKAGDILTFSSIGYFNDTIKVFSFMIDSGCIVMLRERIKILPTFTVTGSWNKYQLDSINRREDYHHIYEKTSVKFAGSHTPANGAGIVLSPITFFSKKSKQVRIFKNNQEKNEIEYYIDYKFSKEYVSKLTRLHGDSLQLFMQKYRPSYSFCRKASSEDMLLYINKWLKVFLNH